METEKINTEREKWNRVYNNNVKYNQDANSKILELINNLNNKELKILDLGCGTGDLSMYLNKAGYDVTGIDISDVAIEKAKMTHFSHKDSECSEDGEVVLIKNSKSLKFLVEDIYDVKESYDVIICKLVYAFIIDKKAFLEKLKSVLNKNGKFIISALVITKENKDKVAKPGICITEEDIEDLKNYFQVVKYSIESTDRFGDTSIIECSE